MAIGPATTRAKAKVATREKILAAAREAFHHRGYDAVTIRGLAQDIGMSTGAVFASFKSKEVLFEAATGHPAPDVPAFLERVVDAARLASVNPERSQALAALATEARRLRGQILGHHA